MAARTVSGNPQKKAVYDKWYENRSSIEQLKFDNYLEEYRAKKQGERQSKQEKKMRQEKKEKMSLYDLIMAE
ncbi:MAG: hypothetical protein LBI42_14670 [Chitinispirillales bacterium]|jgi:hypothetical protein|nr:hypothetical protein [Chitinispirillales bacterium]